jgi:hypothetical protein
VQAAQSPAPLQNERRDRTLHSLYDRLGGPAERARAGDCPLELTGIAVTAEQTSDGAALVFTTTESMIELRRRVAALVRAELAMVPEARVRVDNVEQGVRLVFVPARAADLEPLRERIRQRSVQMIESCPGMQIARVRGEDDEATPDTERPPTAGDDTAERPAPSILDQEPSEPPASDAKPDADDTPDQRESKERDDESDQSDGQGEDENEQDDEDEDARPPLIDDGGDGL